MALLDFLGNSVSGTTAQGPNLTGNAGIPQGMTYGDLLAGLARYGSKTGSSAQALAPLVPGQSNINTAAMLPIQRQRQPKQDSTASILSALASAWGLI